MFRSRFFWRNFLSYTLIISLTTFIVSYLLTVKTQELVESYSSSDLRQKLDVITSSLRLGSIEWSHENLSEVFAPIAEAGNLRISLVDNEGWVLYDSMMSFQDMENHKNRPELLAAAYSGYGEATRTSASVNLPMKYMAKSIQVDDDTKFLRLAMPLSRLTQRLDDIQTALGIGASAGMLLALCIALFLARQMTKPIAAITQVAEAISRGNYSARLRHLPKNDLGKLGGAINRLAEAVQANISQREKVEKVKREFSSNISHELKTPLTSIKGYVETLQEGAIEDPKLGQKFLGIISSNIERIISLVNDLLNLATIEANEGIITLSKVDWRPVIQEVIGRQDINMSRKNITLELNIHDATPCVTGSRKAMTHILDNLVQNAVNYTPENGVVGIELMQDLDHVVIHVRDNGIGIAKSDQKRIFERFYRVDSARSRDVGGTGLGLAIVKHLVIQIQGTISVTSELEQGTDFMVRLPIYDGDL
ncbi:MAG: HAMP domain-containing protein [Pseudobacteriovorax sp.]|nr:HAMP domain-containing protein [Pseudobacteriovorax sp.]